MDLHVLPSLLHHTAYLQGRRITLSWTRLRFGKNRKQRPIVGAAEYFLIITFLGKLLTLDLG